MEILTVKLPTKVAYEIADHKRATFALGEKSTEQGTLLVFSGEGGDADNPALATVALAELVACRWNGRKFIYYLEDVVPLVPHFPILMEERVVRREVPDELIEFYPSSENLRRWMIK